MFGNKYSGDKIASEFQKILEKKASLNAEMKKSAQVATQPEQAPASDVNPEDFLVSVEEKEDVGESLDNKISDITSYSDDKCDKCNMAMDSCACDEHKSLAEDISHELFNEKHAFILEGLGKIAKGLREKENFFASDMVEATAMSIKDDLIKEAGKKIMAISELNKIASSFKASGDTMAADLVDATILKIKRS